MAIRSPLTDLPEYEHRLAAACWPIPMALFKVFKAGLYATFALAGSWLFLSADLQPTTMQVGLVGLFTFLTVLFVEVHEIDLASGIASLSVTFAVGHDDEADVDPPDDDDQPPDP